MTQDYKVKIGATLTVIFGVVMFLVQAYLPQYKEVAQTVVNAAIAIFGIWTGYQAVTFVADTNARAIIKSKEMDLEEAKEYSKSIERKLMDPAG
jgi:hypothetical protein